VNALAFTKAQKLMNARIHQGAQTDECTYSSLRNKMNLHIHLFGT